MLTALLPCLYVPACLEQNLPPSRQSSQPGSSASRCSVTKSCLILCDPMDHSTPSSSVLQNLPEFAQTQRPLSPWCRPTISSCATPFSSCLQFSPASGSFFPQHQGLFFPGIRVFFSPASGSFPVNQLFTSGGKVLELQCQSYQSIFRVDFL